MASDPQSSDLKNSTLQDRSRGNHCSVIILFLPAIKRKPRRNHKTHDFLRFQAEKLAVKAALEKNRVSRNIKKGLSRFQFYDLHYERS